MIKLQRAGLFLGLALLTFQSAFAQQLAISGTVLDGGGAVPDAQVTLRDSVGKTTKTVTDGKGQYHFDGLRPGSYEIGVTRQGFLPQTRTLTLNEETKSIDLSLQVAGGVSSIDVNDVVDRGTASGMEVANREIPSYTVSVTEQTMRDQGINDLPKALENVSGVMTQVQYGVYEWYTISGITQQSGTDFLYVDGMTLTGNRSMTQLNNIEEVQVLKGPNSILYGGSGAGQGGMINLVRKKPSALRSTELQYRVGRYGLDQVTGSSTGRVFGINRLLYRADASYSHVDGWRQNGANRFTAVPELTWLFTPTMSVTAIETFTRDRFTLDAGIPAALLAIPNFPLDRKLNPKGDFELSRDWQTEIDYRWRINKHWTLKNTFFKRKNRDQYNDAETETYVPASNQVNRSILYYQRNQRPLQDLTDVTGDYSFWNMRHRFLVRYDYSDQYQYSYRTGSAPGLSNSTLLPLPPVPIPAFIAGTWVDTAPEYTTFPITRIDGLETRYHRVVLQDQVDLFKWIGVNATISLPGYDRWSHNDNYNDGVFLSAGALTHITQHTKSNNRFGAALTDYAADQLFGFQPYFSYNSSFNPVTLVNADGTLLDPVINKSFEAGTRWRSPNRRFSVQTGFRRIQDQNRVVTISPGVFEQVGKATTYSMDLDVNGSLGRGFTVLANYAYADSLIDKFRTDGAPQTNGGKRFPHAPKHISTIHLSKQFRIGEETRLTFGVGGRYVRHYFTNQANTTIVPSLTVFDGSASLTRKKYDVQVNVSNLTDLDRYFTSVINGSQLYPGAPISATLTLRYRFW